MSILPQGYEMIIANRDARISGAKGGGVTLLFRKPYTILSNHSYKFASFEAISATVKFSTCTLSADQYFKYLYLKYVFEIHLKYFVFVFEIYL